MSITKGMDYYIANEEKPSYGFTPDADFPMIYGEKGVLEAEFVLELPDGETMTIDGGEASNAVPDHCKAVIGDLEIECDGIAAHASTPWDGDNAISKVMAKLYEQKDSLACSDAFKRFIDFYNDKIGTDIYGNKIGCGFEDEITGKLTFNAGLINVKNGMLSLKVDMRTPITSDKDTIVDQLRKESAKYNVKVRNVDFMEPVFLPPDSHLATTLMDVYRQETGDVSKPLTMGGCTYARAMENIVAFGPVFPGRELTEHTKNEHIYVEDLFKIKSIYKKAIKCLSESNS